MNHSPSNARMGVLYAIVTSCLWGFLAIGLRVVSLHVSSTNIVWVRFGVAFISLAAYCVVYKPTAFRIFKILPWTLLLASAALAANYWGFMKGIELAGPARTQVVIQLGPLLLAFYGFIFLKERPKAIQLWGYVLAGIGLLLFYEQELKTFTGETELLNLGLAAVVFAALTWTLYAILQKRLVKDHSPNSLNLVVYGFAFCLFIPLGDSQELSQLPPWIWGLLILFGLNTLVAYGSLSYALKHAPAYQVSVIITMNPIITLATLSLLHVLQVSWIETELMPFWSWIGTALVLFGAVLAIAGPRLFKRPTPN